jgi:hypothetical protein
MEGAEVVTHHIFDSSAVAADTYNTRSIYHNYGRRQCHTTIAQSAS